jgi:hypothetical protein
MDAYVIASVRSGIERELERIFPGCNIKVWQPIKIEPKGHLKAAIQYVEDALERGEGVITYKAIYEALDLDKSNFRKLVSETDIWDEAMCSLGMFVDRGPRGARQLRSYSELLSDT